MHRIKFTAVAVMAVGMLLIPRQALSELCTTQSQMAAADRDALAFAATGLASKVQARDVAGLRAVSVAEIAKDFAGVSDVLGNISPKLKGGTLAVDQVYLLDASTLKRAADGTATDAQFFCTLNRSTAEADFLIPALPPGKYAFAIVQVQSGAAPWRLSFLLRQEQGKWLMAGLYPKPATAAGHDGLWYWTQARQMGTRKEPWSAWLYYQQAEALLQPAGFVQSTHLEKLRTEVTSVAPPALSEGVTVDAPLVVKGADGAEYHFTSLGVDDSLNNPAIDIAVHLKVDQVGDQAVARKRNIAAMSALLAAHPELRKSFHGIWVFADVAGSNAFATEQAIKDIP